MGWFGIIAQHPVVLCVFLALGAGCARDRPIHPMRLDGFPGAPIEAGLFPLAPGARWTFRDRLDPARALELSLREEAGTLVLEGTREGGVEVHLNAGFLELRYEGQVVERPLKLEGRVGDAWEAAGARYTAFGYDEVEVLGRRVRALVVAAERRGNRDLYWFARGLGWVRLRTEQQGKVYRDALLESFEPGRPN